MHLTAGGVSSSRGWDPRRTEQWRSSWGPGAGIGPWGHPLPPHPISMQLLSSSLSFLLQFSHSLTCVFKKTFSSLHLTYFAKHEP